jgi:hypothetical protein
LCSDLLPSANDAANHLVDCSLAGGAHSGHLPPPRRWEVRVYAGIDPLTGKSHRISRQVRGSRKQAEREETRLKAEVMAGRHRGTAAKTFGELVELYLDSSGLGDAPLR